MKYEAIFHRLDEAFLEAAGMKVEEFLPLCRERIDALQEEILRNPGPSVEGKFRITMRNDLVFGRFVEVELQHCIGGAWQTRALGFLDTRGDTRVLYVSRSETLGGQQQITRPQWNDPNAFSAPSPADMGFKVFLGRVDVRAQKKIIGLLDAQAEIWEEDTLQAA